jgi:CPA2 family monovalent cation:H+ antiporter-2
VAFLIVAGLGYGLRTGLVVSAALAQIGEFSFILATLGMMLELVPGEAISLVLAGSIISITLNPFLFNKIDELEHLLSRLGWLERFARRRDPETTAALGVRRHVIICGYGRAGSSLARVLHGRGLPFVIVDNDPFAVERARSAGWSCVYGDATQPAVLEQAQAEQAQSLAVTFGDQPSAPITVQNARRLNNRINVVARGAGTEANRLLRESGAAEVVDPYLEASLEFVRHVLHRYGIDAREITALQMQRRAEEVGG